ncbi:MAG: hypothetical protein WKF43_01380 [Acidimicrobiales bacterium]
MPTGPSPQPRSAVWVVRLNRHERAAPGSVGPFLREAEARTWVTTVLDGTEGWTFTIETVVPPEALPSRSAPRPKRHLHLVS